jgi:hypothetical protein
MSEYVRLHMPSHPAANSKGYVYEHTVIAERVLGKRMPNGAAVHHVNENTRDNSHTNLVICQDRAYHKLLHVRARVVRAGANPNTHALCGQCGHAKPFEAFNKSTANKSFGRQRRCRECSRASFKQWWKTGRTAA